jgi:hypothetical protein
MLIAFWLAAASGVQAGPIVSGQFFSTLTTGSLAGLSFPVTFSYDGGQVNPAGDSFITLNSINFTLLGVAFAKGNILQGGQVILHNGVIQDVTASFQGGPLPPNPPVENITFGFGGNGVIGYIDLNGQFGNGSFTFVPEPAPLGPIAACSLMLVCGGAVLATPSTGSDSARQAPCSAIRMKCLWRINRRQ